MTFERRDSLSYGLADELVRCVVDADHQLRCVPSKTRIQTHLAVAYKIIIFQPPIC